jgi:hypothetical protein
MRIKEKQVKIKKKGKHTTKTTKGKIYHSTQQKAKKKRTELNIVICGWMKEKHKKNIDNGRRARERRENRKGEQGTNVRQSTVMAFFQCSSKADKPGKKKKNDKYTP